MYTSIVTFIPMLPCRTCQRPPWPPGPAPRHPKRSNSPEPGSEGSARAPALHCSGIALHYIVPAHVQYTLHALHCTALKCTVLHFTAPPVQHCTVYAQNSGLFVEVFTESASLASPDRFSDKVAMNVCLCVTIQNTLFRRS